MARIPKPVFVVEQRYTDMLIAGISAFFKKEADKAENKINQLISTALGVTGGIYIRYGDEEFSVEKINVPPGFKIPNKSSITNDLPEDFHSEMDDLLVIRNKIMSDIRTTRLTFSAASVRCSSDQDYRDVFPDIIHKENMEIRELPRTRDVGFLLKDNVKLFRQFESGIDVLNFHIFNMMVL